jgi:hypothetical protein
MIWPDELEAGEINHALGFSYSYPKAGGPVLPATESDGRSRRRDAIPEGALIQLNPDLDLDTLGLTTYEMTVAKALQDYGMFLGDIGGGIELEVINSISVQGDPYEGLFGSQDGKRYVYLNNIPINEFRVLKLGPQDPDPDIELVPSGCADFELK